MRIIPLCILSFCVQISTAQDTPVSLRSDVTVEHYMDVRPNVSRMGYDALLQKLFYLTVDGDVYRIDEGFDEPYDTLMFNAIDHGVSSAYGMVFHDSDLFISGNVVDGDYWEGVIARGHMMADGSRVWSDVARSEPYARGGKDHGFNGITVTPDGSHLIVNSGSRTDHGEVQEHNGIFPGLREEPVSSIILQLPIDGLDVIIPNTSEALATSGLVFALGVRNTYDLAFNAQGHLFGVENSGDHDDPEEMNWIQAGRHYGFPWEAGGNHNPTTESNYDPTEDPLLNQGFPSAATDFYYDPLFPTQPPGLLLTAPLVNHGPDADNFRTLDRGIGDSSDSGMPISTFTCHRSPLGLVMDNAYELGGDYYGDAFMASFTPGGDTTGFSPFAPWGIPVVPVDQSGDLVHLDLFYDQPNNSYSVAAKRIVKGFYLPVDAEIVGNTIYVIEYWTSAQRSLWRVTFPAAVSVLEQDPAIMGVAVFPNPTSALLQWRTSTGTISIAEIYNTIGERISSERVNGSTGTLDVSQLANGSYFVRMLGNGIWTSRSFMIVR